MKQVKTHCGFSPFNYCNQMTIISFLKNVGDFSSDVVAQRNLMPCSCVEWKFLVCSLHNPPSPCYQDVVFLDTPTPLFVTTWFIYK